MKIEKGKLYYDTHRNLVFKAHEDNNKERAHITNKIAVHCPTKEYWDYVNKIMGWKWDFSPKHLIRLLDSENYRLYDIQDAKEKNYHIITIDQFKEFYPIEVEQDPYVWGSIDISRKKDVIVQNNELKHKETFNPQPHYDNSKGSLYKVATERGWNAYLFDVVKRLERGGKKDPLRQEIEKSIDVLKIWLSEIK